MPLLPPFTLLTEQHINVGWDTQGPVCNVLQQGGFAFPAMREGQKNKNPMDKSKGKPPAPCHSSSPVPCSATPPAELSIYLPVGSHEAIPAPGHDVQIRIDKELFAMSRDAELLQLQ